LSIPCTTVKTSLYKLHDLHIRMGSTLQGRSTIAYTLLCIRPITIFPLNIRVVDYNRRDILPAWNEVFTVFESPHSSYIHGGPKTSGRFVKREQWNVGEPSGNWCLGLSSLLHRLQSFCLYRMGDCHLQHFLEFRALIFGFGRCLW